MTFRTSWGISFHEYLVPLFSVGISGPNRPGRIRVATPSGPNPGDPERIRARSNRAKPKDLIGRKPNGTHPVDPEGSHPVETEGPHPVETENSHSVDPERPSSGRPRPHPRKVQPYPVETQVDPGRIRVGELDWPASSRTDRPLSGRRRSTPTGPHPGEPDRPASG